MERIVFLERNTIQADFRRPNFDHEWVEYADTLPQEVVERVRPASIIISNKLSLGEPQLSHAPDVKLIAIAATGSDCVDLDYCRRRGITVCNVRGYAVNSVPEHVLMLILALRRNLLAYRARCAGWEMAAVETVLFAHSSTARHQRQHDWHHRLWLDRQSPWRGWLNRLA